MEIAIEHRGLQLTLEVYSEGGVDLFTVTGIELADAPYDVRELGKLLDCDAFEIERLGHEELARQRCINRLASQEERAA
ncbi:hypothetical protein [Azotobacter salinestris]|uniref:hypothetical protein n=1 Tax=Azotobacter salinestris TaxID=69964 RepID=UPI001266B491|nr:hypothetical protein [Azotobacter salinestris]